MKQRSVARSAKSQRDLIYESENEKTFQNDATLPSLPIPTLRNTLERYLDSVRPVVADDEFVHTEALCKNFEEGVGKQLQEKLEERGKKCKNWLEEWWQDFAYLQLRAPLIPFCNMSAPMPSLEYWPPQPGSRVDRLALTLYFTMEFWKMLRKEKMRPMVHKGVAWSMDQFKKLFNSVRIPGEDKDILSTTFKTEFEGPAAPTNVIVLYRGYIFSFEIIDRAAEEPLTPQEIAYQLYYIEKWCQAQSSDGLGIGALTTTDRTLWAKNRVHLRSLHKDNEKHLQLIENALIVVVLDDSEPLSQQQLSAESMCGDCSNRWADKSLTSISFKNGTFGANADHTQFDGICTAIMTHYQLMSLNDCKGVWKGVNRFRDLPKPQLIEFHVDEKIHSEIEKAREGFRKNCEDIQILHTVYEEYGKSILRDHSLHPEAFVQVALQLAYYRMYGRPAPTYVTASTRKYYHGRTETCRSCVPESVDFAKAVVEGSASPGELYALLRTAVKKFQRSMADAMNNEGCDRHFLGLYCVSLENGSDIPEIFTDPSFMKSGGGGNYVLSTSCGGYWNICGGVPPMRNDGYGCFYSIEDNRITFVCTAMKNCSETNPEAFFNNIKTSLIDMQNILSASKL